MESFQCNFITRIIGYHTDKFNRWKDLKFSADSSCLDLLTEVYPAINRKQLPVLHDLSDTLKELHCIVTQYLSANDIADCIHDHISCIFAEILFTI